MKSVLQRMTTDQLVDRFMEIALNQDDALLAENYTEVNSLYDQLKEVEEELKSRPGDQRTALLRLYEHPNAQVRVKAIKATLAAAPELARRALEELAASREYPQAGEAGMTIRALNDGIYKPT